MLWGSRGIAGGDRARRRIGARGERIALRHLRSRGMRLVARNLVLNAGEIDLLCRDRGGVLVVVEVKTREIDPEAPGPPPEASITAAKRKKLLLLAGAVARRYRVDARSIRIDVVAVELRKGARAVVRHHLRAVTAPTRRA